MLKIRRPLGRLILNMGIAIPGKTVFLIETAPWIFCNRPQHNYCQFHMAKVYTYYLTQRIPRHAFVPIWTRAGYKMVSIHGPCNEMFSRRMCWSTLMVVHSKKSRASLATTKETDFCNYFVIILSFHFFWIWNHWCKGKNRKNVTDWGQVTHTYVSNLNHPWFR